MSRTTLILLLLAAAGGVLVLSAILTVIARRVALRLDFTDHPGGHKSHETPTPYGGGWAIILSGWVTIGVVLLLAQLMPQAWIIDKFGQTVRAYVGGIHDRSGQMLIILLGGVVLHVLGFLDDKRPLPPLLKLLTIVVVALFVASVGQVRIAEFAGVGISIVLTTAWFIVIVNSFNFLDNMDGLSAGVGCICLAAFAVCGLMAGQVLVPALGCVFLGAVGGFLIFNFPPARIFMGDAGSLVVGYILATVSVLTTYYQSGQGAPPYALAMPLVILAIPLYDFVSVVAIRLVEGRNPLKGDQRHFSHRLVERGLSRRFAVLTIYLAAATTGLAATLLPGADLRRTITVGVMVLMVLSIIAILEAPLRRKA
ncbi:MAG: undecaprenyl/decaprenyl-phosphate alpha-N-acetylglucosaminyl 1-phosphate transferase [Phycisphaerae bacterium]|nr:undecaprenyl/decaprenyl-phosphate alpha-N-acetylglucosaminyl 1-phosphate transferase [Phycisphaerae bacterium]